MPLFRLIRSLFSPRRYRQSPNNGVSPPVYRGWGPVDWVLSRGVCLYRVFVLGDVPPAERQNALNMRIQQWSPFEETGRWVTWEKETAQVWIWDEEVRQKAMAETGVRSARVIPETVLHPRPKEEGLNVVPCGDDGLESQVWRENRLTASHWWPEPPSGDEWRRFLLANDLDPDIEMPLPQDGALLRRPWGRNRRGPARVSLGHEKPWVYIGAAVFSFLLIWEGMAIWRWHRAEEALSEKVTAMTAEYEPRLASRTRFLEEIQAVERLNALAPYPRQMEVMAAVADKIPPQGVRLVEWRYNRGHLVFTVQGSDLDSRYFVKAYQSHPFFTDVTAEKGREPDKLVVEMRIQPGRS